MSEKRLLKTAAHIFRIDPATKSSWQPISKGACPLHVYHDATKRFSRVVAMDGDTALINCILESGVVLTKTSPKFGQWRDPRAKSVFGLGFATEEELEQFAAAFDEAIQSCSEDLGRDPRHSISSVRSVNLSGMARSDSIKSINAAVEQAEGSKGNGTADSASEVATLRYENERLRTALTASKTNADKWEEELRNLRNTNARLTTAMQDSAKNVEQWKVQLAAWKNESNKLKEQLAEERRKVAALDPKLVEEAKAEAVAAKEALTATQEKLDQRDSELEQARRSLDDKEARVRQLEANAKILEADALFKDKYKVLQEELTAWKASFAERVAEMGDFFSAFDGLMS
eukprot:m.166648 g.166648  ORF g.166648 m.166648 type:complete len:345 (-) comp16627_c0_seq2:2222-3256(-)